jgi:hypothetical protein
MGVLVAVLGAPGCTFGGLADYAIDACEPSKTQASDICDRLNKDPATCTPYQCAASRHCVQTTRDDDRDGDPPTKCGGTDCDDANAARSGHAKEICDRLDNDCNGVVDEDALHVGAERMIAPAGTLSSTSDPILVAADDVGSNALASYVTGACFPLISLEPGSGGGIGAGCVVLGTETTLAPRQPYPLRIGTGFAAAFVVTSACPAGRPAYRFESNGSSGVDLACDAAHPAALPTVAAMPASANAKSGLVTWYEASVADRVDPIGGCATLKPASLQVLRLADLTSPTPATRADVLVAQETSASTRPAALTPLDAAGGMLLTTPLGNDVGVWLLTPEVLRGTALPAPVHVASLANARSVAVRTRHEGNTVSVAIAAEIGCYPAASIQLALGTIDVTTKALTFGASVEVVGSTKIATSPSVVWVGARNEWWVQWLDDAPHAKVRRFSAEGKPIGAAIDVGTQVSIATVSAGESVFAVDPGANGGSFVEIPIGCAK